MPEKACPPTTCPLSVIIPSVPGSNGWGVSVTALPGLGAPQSQFRTCLPESHRVGKGADVG